MIEYGTGSMDAQLTLNGILFIIKCNDKHAHIFRMIT